jgi:hypothetical protein
MALSNVRIAGTSTSEVRVRYERASVCYRQKRYSAWSVFLQGELRKKYSSSHTIILQVIKLNIGYVRYRVVHNIYNVSVGGLGLRV